MASPSIASYFNVRKRAAADDIINARNKVSRLETADTPAESSDQVSIDRAIQAKNKLVDADLRSFSSSSLSAGDAKVLEHTTPTITKIKSSSTARVTTSERRRTTRQTAKRGSNSTTSAKAKAAEATKSKGHSTQPKIVKFTLGGTLSPRKKSDADSPSLAFQLVEKNTQTDSPILVTPTIAINQQQNPNSKETATTATETESNAVKVSVGSPINKGLIAKTTPKKELSYDEIKTKIGRSSRLDELKAILIKRQQLEDQYQACLNKRNAKQKAANQLLSPVKVVDGQSLKHFDTIELEVLSSPQKGLRTPTKTPIKTPSKEKSTPHDDLMSPKKAATPRRLFSPTKANAVPAYQRFQTLATDISSATQSSALQLPYKYRCLLEMFRCVDSICSMFYNRKETITFKKLKPAVQRMLRKNFTENHLAQIKYLFPDAYTFEQKKMLNPGSHTKYDYYQLVITPNVQPTVNSSMAVPIGEDNGGKICRIDYDDNIVRNADAKTMNPQIMTARHQRFQQILLDRVKREHDAFLKKLQPPMNIPMEKIRRWHQDFDLEACSDVLPGELPQPPNIEKFSSAKEILSTARNLFNCATPMERMMDRYEVAQLALKTNEMTIPNGDGYKAVENIGKNTANIRTTVTPKTVVVPAATTNDAAAATVNDSVAKILKGVPKSLLEKIRAKQAAKALDAMTRRPSQDVEACKYARLPELARYIRNIFVTENKGVLELDKVMSKLENSYREKMTRDCLRELLELMAKEAPRNWLTFHFIRKTDFIKINRHENLAEIIKELEQKAQEKAE